MIHAHQNIKYLGLSGTICRSLEEASVHCINDLIDLSYKQLEAIPGIGKKAIIKIYEAIRLYKKNHNFLVEELNQKLYQIDKVLEDFRPIVMQVMREELTNFHMQVNELRTVILEQQRILESIQARKTPDGLLSEIDKKIPGFSRTIYDVYKTLENN